MAGLFVGSVFFGWLGDKIGRKWSLCLSMVLANTASLAGAFVNEYISYCVTRFLAAIGNSNSVSFFGK